MDYISILRQNAVGDICTSTVILPNRTVSYDILIKFGLITLTGKINRYGYYNVHTGVMSQSNIQGVLLRSSSMGIFVICRDTKFVKLGRNCVFGC